MTLILNQRRTQQPQMAVGVDWGNPITRGLEFAYVPSSPGVELAKGLRFNSDVGSALTFGVGPSGRSVSGVSSATSYRGWTGITGTPSYTVVAVVLDNVGRNTTRHPVNSDNNAAPASRNFQLRLDTSNKVEFIPFALGGGASFPGLPPNPTSDSSLSVIAGRVDPLGVSQAFTNGIGGTTATLSVLGQAISPDESLSVGSSLIELGGFGGQIYGVYFFNRALSDVEIRSLSENPWQLFSPQVT